MIILFYKRGTHESERLSRLAGVTQLVHGRVRLRAQLSLGPEPAPFLSVSVLRRGPGGRGSIIGGREVEDVVHTQKGPTEERTAMAHSWPKGVGCSWDGLAVNFFLRD